MSQTVDLYYWPTPNGWKVTILLEEAGIDYHVVPVDIGSGAQFEPDFLDISPNNKIPALVDPDGPGGAPISLFESGAILIYLADKCGRFLPVEPRARYQVLQWLMFQVGGVGPMLGQAHHFRQYAPQSIDYAIERYTREAGRLYQVLDRRLAASEYLADAYSIADMAVFPWIVPHRRQGQDLDDFPNLRRWYESIDARPAVRKGMAVLRERRIDPKMDEQARHHLFGEGQYQRS